MAQQIQLRRDTAGNWLAENPILADGEPGYEKDTGRMKYGDGISNWNALPYAISEGTGDGITMVEDLPPTIPPGQIYGTTSGTLPPSGGGGRKSATLVVGFATMGHTEADVDILLTGANDNVLLQRGHDSLPSTGGEIIVLGGTCNLGGAITISKPNVTIRGMGNATVFKRVYNDTEGNGLITITGSNCTLTNFDLNGNRSAYTATVNHGIRLTGGQFARLVGLRIHDTQSAVWGSAGDCNILDCIIDGTNARGLYLNASGCLIKGNTIKSATTAINLYSAAAVNNVVIGNILLSNSTGVLLSGGAARNTVTGNHIMRGTGLAGDYTTDQYTIRLTDAATANNLITNNMIFGKDVADAATGTTLANNKYN